MKKLKSKLLPPKSRFEKRGQYQLVKSFNTHAKMTSIRLKFTKQSKSTSSSSSSTSSTSTSSTSSSSTATTKVDDAVQLEEEDREGYVDVEEDNDDDQESHEKRSQNTSSTPISIDTFTNTDDDNDENDDDFAMGLNELMPRDHPYDSVVVSTERTMLGPLPDDTPSKNNRWVPRSSPSKIKSNYNSKSSVSNHRLTPPKQNKSKKQKLAQQPSPRQVR